jgi:hypothetical protein
MLTVEILQLPMLRPFLSSEYSAPELSQVSSASLGSSLYSPGEDPIENTAPQHFIYCCYVQLPNDSSDIVDVFIGRYQATADVSSFVSRSLPSSGSVDHIIITITTVTTTIYSVGSLSL